MVKFTIELREAEALCRSRKMFDNGLSSSGWASLLLLVFGGALISNGQAVSTSSYLAQADTSTSTQNWIIVLKPTVDPDAFAATLCAETNPLRKKHGYSCADTFRTLLRGVSGQFSRAAIRELLQQYKDSVDHATRDRGISVGDQLQTEAEETEASQQQASSGGARSAARRLPEQLDPVTWGLDRIDQAKLPLDQIYHYDSVGTGVHVYILDSGIRATHQQFRIMAPAYIQKQGQPIQTVNGTRVVAGFSAYGGTGPDSTTDDCFGHGTHVAATIGGLDNGVAKNVTLHPVKVLDCYGNANETTLLRGLEWVARNVQYPAIVHMSLEGYYSSPINAAIEDLVQRLGVVVVASAGNHNADACTVSPASANSAIAVGAINVDGSRWYRSNWGPCMDLFAPGVNVVSAVPWTDSSEAPKTGTSMAAPFVTGVAALYLENHQGASPADAAQRLLRSSMMGAVTDDTSGMATFTPTPRSSGWGPIDISSTPNRLLQSVLTIPARLLPSVITVAATSGAPGPSASAAAGRDITVSLLLQPSGQVNVTASVPNAWTGQPLATIFPSALTFTAENYNREQRLLLQPNAAAAQGAYYVQLAMRSSDPRFDFAVQVVKVDDAREQVGETAAVPRVIRSLPFNDSGATISFRHDYNTSAGNPKDTAPDVVYAYTPAFAMTVTASTCGSTYDTVLLLGQAPLRLAETLANDDDPACGSASRIDTDLQPGRTYYVVVSGFNGAAGDFALSVRCTSCDGAGGGSGGGGGLPAASRR